MGKFITSTAVTALDQMTNEASPSLVNYSGLGNEKKPEIVATPLQTGNTTIIQGRVSAHISIKNDSPNGIMSGYGGVGKDGSATIDLVSGLGGSRPVDYINSSSIDLPTSFEFDSARVYISQRCNIDEYFNIPKSFIPLKNSNLPVQQSVGYSAVGIKADCVRVIARDNIVIGTTNLGILSNTQEANPNGVDIIAGIHLQNDTPQPMVKGSNLIACLTRMMIEMKNIQETIVSLRDNQQIINKFLANHVHDMRSPQLTNSPLLKSQMDNFILKLDDETKNYISNYVNFEEAKAKYFISSEPLSIISKYNRVN